MRLLAVENFPALAFSALHEAGHDVAWVRTDAPGSRDVDVLARAVGEQRVLLTFDRDFGELAFKDGLSAASGIVLFRISVSRQTIASDVVAILAARQQWAGTFAVAEPGRIRVRDLPQTR